VSRSSIAFAIQAPEEVARERMRQVLRFYDPCGELDVRVRRDRALGLTIGEVLIGRAAAAGDTRAGVIFSAGERLPAQLTDPEKLLDASDAQLRALDGAQAAVAASDGRARIVAGAGAPRCWFHAGDAYATSVAAAALLGGVSTVVIPDSLPELLVMGTCLTQRTHVTGVRALTPSTVVDFGSGEHEAWPRLARWAAVEPAAAGKHAWTALTDTLTRRLEGEPAAWVSLYERDGALLLAAAAELGVDLPAFSPLGADDAPEVAATYGMGHEFCAETTIETETGAREKALRDALLGDGAQALEPFEIAGHPHTASAALTGFGGQTARAASYAHNAHARPQPPPAELASATGLPQTTAADHRPSIEIKLREWFELAADCGHRDWSAIDMLLIEEGVGAHAGAERLPLAIRQPLRAPEVARALSSLPLADRVARSWQRDALAALEPDAVATRTAPAIRARLDAFERLPRIQDWLLDEPLTSSLLTTGLGDLWVERLQAGVREGEPDMTEQALAAAAVVIFDQRLQAAAQPPPDGL
jgi:hypothetical protein